MPFKKNDPNINRNGRPPSGESWADIIRDIADEADESTGVQKKYLVVRKLFEIAESGNVHAIKEIGDRIDGKVVAKSGEITELDQTLPQSDFAKIALESIQKIYCDDPNDEQKSD